MLRTLDGLPVAEPFATAPVKARDKRNGYEIHAYTGTNGGGKTMCAVFDSLPSLAAGRPIVSTCRILDPTTGEPHPLWVPLDDFRVLLELEYCDVILDEVTGVASSRDSAGLPSVVLNHLMQLRKGDVTVRWTTPNWKRADVGLREVTKAITTCVGVAPVDRQIVTDDGLVRRWRPRRGFVWRTYDAKNFDEWSTTKERSSAKHHRIKCEARQFVWGPWSMAREFYDTYEHALTLGVVSEAGLCMDCGGKRRAKPCACHPDEAAHHEPSTGMLRWREVDAARRSPSIARPDFTESSAPGRRLLIAETDDTPGVVVETLA